MSIAIATGATGIVGWKILQRTEARQMEALQKDSTVQRSSTYLRDNIATAGSAEALFGDYRLLSAVLSAFGLEGDVANKAFIRKVLEADPADKNSLVNRLSDKRYLRLTEALGFGSADGPTPDLGERVSAAFLEREFERRVGQGDENLRLALNARRELQDFAGRDSSDRTLWYEVMGNPPLRKVFEGAFGFGPSFGQLPVERQNQEFMKAAERFLGTSSFEKIATPETTERLVQNFLARSQLTETAVQNRYSAALSLLMGS